MLHTGGMNTQSAPPRPYPFTLDQVTGKTSPPAVSEEEDRQRWEAVDAGQTPGEMSWKSVFTSLYGGDLSSTYSSRALHLQANGDEPETLAEMCTSPRSLVHLRDTEGMDTAEVAEHAVLLHEVAIYFAYWQERVLAKRAGYVVSLRGQGWTQVQIASLLGMTKQRVHAILEGRPTVGDEGARRRVVPLTPMEARVDRARAQADSEGDSEGDAQEQVAQTVRRAHQMDRAVGRGDEGRGGVTS